jgi:hypothetical protein
MAGCLYMETKLGNTQPRVPELTSTQHGLSCRYMNNKFPYPFMNQMHPAIAYFSMLMLSLVVMHMISLSGVAISSVSKRAFSKPDLLALQPENGNSKAKVANGKRAKAC